MRLNLAHGALMALAALVSAPAFAADPALAPTDFAWGRTVEMQRAGALQTLLLDLPVYRGSIGPELADLRVWNAAGEGVPHAIRALVDPSEQEGALVSVPLFRVPEESALARAAASARASGAVPATVVVHAAQAGDVAIEIASDGAIRRVGPDAATGGEARPPSAYLVDLSQLERPVVGLELALAATPAECVAPLRVDASDDLQALDPVNLRAVIVRLDQAGQHIERSGIPLSGVKRRYLLLSAAGPLPVEVTAVRARLAPVVEPPPRQRERIEGQVSRSEPKASEDHPVGGRTEFVFDLGGAIPVDRVQVDLPAANTVIEADLFSASEASGPWLHHYSGVLYQLDHPDGALRNEEIVVPPIRRRYFKLAVAEKGGGLGGGTPALEVAWMPEQLLFVARGAGPFSIGYGRAQAEGSRFDAAELIRSALPPDADPRREIPRETARLGLQRAVGNPSVLEPRAEPIPPRTIALWGVLVGSVLVVLALSMRLLRRIGPS
jgi:Protein of unknown function (DUF3999)